MVLQNLSLFNFKNYPETQLDFCDHINCIVGLNGSGKTNILDAIHYLSLTKSAFNAMDSQNIKRGETFFVVNGQMMIGDKQHQLHCSLKKGEKKLFKVDDSPYEKLSAHIGKFPVVLIAPNDDELIRDSNETRRNFLNSVISQTDKKYLTVLIKYTNALKQRNAVLKKFSESYKVDQVLIETYDEIIISGSQSIAKTRKTFIDQFLPHFKTNYEVLSDKKETVGIEYNSSALDVDFAKKYKHSLDRDLASQRTNLGVHRDEILLTIDGYPLKKMGSQGQQKSVLVSLKLAQFEVIAKALNKKPILLLDDIFDKLDDLRIQKLLEMIATDQFGQIFITDAREERTRELLGKGFDPVKILKVG